MIRLKKEYVGDRQVKKGITGTYNFCINPTNKSALPHTMPERRRKNGTPPNLHHLLKFFNNSSRSAAENVGFHDSPLVVVAAVAASVAFAAAAAAAAPLTTMVWIFTSPSSFFTSVLSLSSSATLTMLPSLSLGLRCQPVLNSFPISKRGKAWASVLKTT